MSVRVHLLLAAAAATALLVLGTRPALAVKLWIDRTRRMIDVSAECNAATANAAFTQNLAYSSAAAPNPPGVAVNLNAVDGRFTLVLSSTTQLLARAHNNAL